VTKNKYRRNTNNSNQRWN